MRKLKSVEKSIVWWQLRGVYVNLGNFDYFLFNTKIEKV